MQFYDALGLAPKLALDPEELKKRFYERSRQWHPDRFSRASAEEQQKSLEMTSMLNDAFRTLRDPVARAEYFLEQKSICRWRVGLHQGAHLSLAALHAQLQ